MGVPKFAFWEWLFQVPLGMMRITEAPFRARLNTKKAEDNSSAIYPGRDRLSGHINTQITS